MKPSAEKEFSVVSRLRRIVVAIASAACVAVAFTGSVTAPALAQSAHTPTQSAPAAPAAVKLPAAVAAPGPCGDGNGYNGANRFWRCTGSSVTSDWVASTTCAEGEYNAITSYNVWGAINNCTTRVWLHQFMNPKDTTSGWAICIPPASAVSWIFPVNEAPQNFMISANSAACTPVLP
jgi:hypothetical protein